MGRDSTILVGVDGSAPGDRALQWAVAAAVRHGWGLRLVCTYALPSFATAAMDGGYAAFDDTAIADGARAVLDDAAALARTAGVAVTTEVATGDAAGVLVELSREAALVVVGTRGRGGFADRLLGTVSSALPAHAHAPTVVVPFRAPTSEPTAPGDDDGSDPWGRAPGTVLSSGGPGPMPPVRSIVVGVDGSEQSRRALRYAAREAEVWGASLTAVAAVPLVASTGVLAWLPAVVDHEQILAESARELDAVVDEVLADHPRVTARRMVLDGTGAQLLTEFSSATDLVVLGSRGRGGFRGLLLGSTSQAVLHHARCAVMVVTDRAGDLPAG